MPTWIIIAALGSVAITAALAWVLWRVNNPTPARGPAASRRDSSVSGGGVPFVADTGGGKHSDHGSDSSSDGGGGGE